MGSGHSAGLPNPSWSHALIYCFLLPQTWASPEVTPGHPPHLSLPQGRPLAPCPQTSCSVLPRPRQLHQGLPSMPQTHLSQTRLRRHPTPSPQLCLDFQCHRRSEHPSLSRPTAPAFQALLCLSLLHVAPLNTFREHSLLLIRQLNTPHPSPLST